jgi:hypothetical protein
MVEIAAMREKVHLLAEKLLFSPLPWGHQIKA